MAASLSLRVLDHFKPRSLQHRPNEHVKPEIRNEYLRNYRVQKFLSFATLSAASVCALKAVHLLTMGPVSLMVLALSVSALVLGKIWYTRQNDPKRLAESAWQAMKDGDEEKALELLKKGADLDFKIEVEDCNLPFAWSWELPTKSFLEYASKEGHHEVLQYLIDVGSQREHTRAFQCAQKLYTVKLLDRYSFPLNNTPEEETISPLGAHLLKVWAFLEMEEVPRQEIREECSIIQHLCKRGAAIWDPEIEAFPGGIPKCPFYALLDIINKDPDGPISDDIAELKSFYNGWNAQGSSAEEKE